MINNERKARQRKEQELQKSNETFRSKLEHYRSAYKELFGIGRVGMFSSKIKHVLEVAYFFHRDRSVPVLIEGETGTGKEIVARVVHFGKDGDTRPFISINCAAISPHLFESELFGYEEGAFTGSRPGGMLGKLELAQGGTLFLDEIGEMPSEMQPKLLRVIQQKEFYRIGGQKSIALDVRIICATNRDLKIEMQEKRFRSDLYYRLSTGRITIPPLRERQEEIAPLAQMFLTQFAEEKRKPFKFIEHDALNVLESYDWPGNIRELQNTIERIILLYNDTSIRREYLSFLHNGDDEELAQMPQTITIDLPEDGVNIKDIQRTIMKTVLDRFGGNKTQAADFLKMSRKTFYQHDLTK